MRIAHLIDDLGCGGAQHVVVGLAVCQSRSGHPVEVICLRDVGEDAIDIGALTAAGVEIIELRKPPGFHIGTLRALAHRLKRGRFDVLHAHNHLVHHYGAVAARWARVPAILNTLHGTDSLQKSAGWSKLLFWTACLIGDKVVCVDPKVRDVIQSAYPLLQDRIAVIRNGVALARFLELRRSAPGKVVTFGTIARLVPVKGHTVLLQALAALKKTYPDVRLRLLGDGPLMPDLQALAAVLDIAEEVRFEGYHLDTPGFLRDVDIFVIPSLSEGLPLALLEAMGAGLPVVATAVGGITEIIERSGAGWLCQPDDPHLLEAAMRKALLADRAVIGARARDAVREVFSVERMAREYETLYAEMLAGRELAREAKQ
jgi:glycosyltransferase involved in cell wall biosynthesis